MERVTKLVADRVVRGYGPKSYTVLFYGPGARDTSDEPGGVQELAREHGGTVEAPGVAHFDGLRAARMFAQALGNYNGIDEVEIRDDSTDEVVRGGVVDNAVVQLTGSYDHVEVSDSVDKFHGEWGQRYADGTVYVHFKDRADADAFLEEVKVTGVEAEYVAGRPLRREELSARKSLDGAYSAVQAALSRVGLLLKGTADSVESGLLAIQDKLDRARVDPSIDLSSIAQDLETELSVLRHTHDLDADEDVRGIYDAIDHAIAQLNEMTETGTEHRSVTRAAGRDEYTALLDELNATLRKAGTPSDSVIDDIDRIDAANVNSDRPEDARLKALVDAFYEFHDNLAIYEKNVPDEPDAEDLPDEGQWQAAIDGAREVAKLADDLGKRRIANAFEKYALALEELDYGPWREQYIDEVEHGADKQERSVRRSVRKSLSDVKVELDEALRLMTEYGLTDEPIKESVESAAEYTERAKLDPTLSVAELIRMLEDNADDWDNVDADDEAYSEIQLALRAAWTAAQRLVESSSSHSKSVGVRRSGGFDFWITVRDLIDWLDRNGGSPMDPDADGFDDWADRLRVANRGPDDDEASTLEAKAIVDEMWQQRSELPTALKRLVIDAHDAFDASDRSDEEGQKVSFRADQLGTRAYQGGVHRAGGTAHLEVLLDRLLSAIEDSFEDGDPAAATTMEAAQGQINELESAGEAQDAERMGVALSRLRQMFRGRRYAPTAQLDEIGRFIQSALLDQRGETTRSVRRTVHPDADLPRADEPRQYRGPFTVEVEFADADSIERGNLGSLEDVLPNEYRRGMDLADKLYQYVEDEISEIVGDLLEGDDDESMFDQELSAISSAIRQGDVQGIDDGLGALFDALDDHASSDQIAEAHDAAEKLGEYVHALGGDEIGVERAGVPGVPDAIEGDVPNEGEATGGYDVARALALLEGLKNTVYGFGLTGAAAAMASDLEDVRLDGEWMDTGEERGRSFQTVFYTVGAKLDAIVQEYDGDRSCAKVVSQVEDLIAWLEDEGPGLRDEFWDSIEVPDEEDLRKDLDDAAEDDLGVADGEAWKFDELESAKSFAATIEDRPGVNYAAVYDADGRSVIVAAIGGEPPRFGTGDRSPKREDFAESRSVRRSSGSFSASVVVPLQLSRGPETPANLRDAKVYCTVAASGKWRHLPERGPSYSSGGEPAEDGFDVDSAVIEEVEVDSAPDGDAFVEQAARDLLVGKDYFDFADADEVDALYEAASNAARDD